MKLQFSTIKNGNIFEDDFLHLDDQNGTISFKHMHSKGGIAVVYAPNGTGKTSFVSNLKAKASTDKLSFSAMDDKGNTIVPEDDSFQIIEDQISRNIIQGKETDYLIGSQIKHEYELRDRIDKAFSTVFSTLAAKYKTEYKVSKVGDYLLAQIGTIHQELYPEAYRYIRSIVNSRTHGSDIDRDKFVAFLRESNIAPLELDEVKRKFIINDAVKVKVVDLVRSIDDTAIVGTSDTVLVQREDDAIGLLRKYPHMHTCIVCDNDNIDSDALLTRKQESRKRIYDTLTDPIKKLLEKVVREPSLAVSDPFEIRRIVGDFIAGADPTELIHLKLDLERYVRVIGDEMVQALLNCFDGTSLYADYDEYNELVKIQPELDNEELMYIQDVISENIDKDITIQRDDQGNDKNYKLMLGDIQLLGTERKDLHLSTGEQNFISLAFELLLARHSNKEYVVLDDPISSFDSVYKNKIAFCIVKFLEDKKQIVLTHNLDLVRLLEVQLKGCFNLYLLNNSENGKNGFIPISEKEKGLLINMHELIKLFQCTELSALIHNRRQFLMALIPFMRGYAHISLDPNDYYGRLSSVMHGYSTESIDIIPIYYELFGVNLGGTEMICSADVLGLDVNNLDLMDSAEYPLLAETLEQTLIYYYLRMKVEKVLVDVFHVNIRPNDPMTLNEIIQKALRCSQSDPDFEAKRELRVFFTSRKTLLNEFNHFEGNMNIFQPAIDISRSALKKEIISIENMLAEIQRLYA